MAPDRRVKRADGNQADIISALEQTGHSVQILSQVGSGCPDLLVARSGTNVLLEVKMPGKELKPHQSIWHKSWNGAVYTVHDGVEAINAVSDAIRKRR